MRRQRWHIELLRNLGWSPTWAGSKTQGDWGVFSTDVLKSDSTSQMQIVFEHFRKNLLHTLMTFLERQSDLFHVKELSGDLELSVCESSNFITFRCECVVGWNFHSHRLSKFWGRTIWVGYFLEITVVVLFFWNQKRCRRLYSSWVRFVQFASDFCGWVSQKSDGDAKGFREGEATPAKILMFSTSVKILPIQYQSWRQSFMPEIWTEVNQMYKPRLPTPKKDETTTTAHYRWNFCLPWSDLNVSAIFSTFPPSFWVVLVCQAEKNAAETVQWISGLGQIYFRTLVQMCFLICAG